MSDFLEIKTPRLFTVLGVLPFWLLTPEDQTKLRSAYMALSRKYHPDLIPEGADEKERERIEGLSSEINSAYRKLQERSSRISAIFEEIESQRPDEFKFKDYVKLPMELSMEYFELQETLEENANDADTQSQLQEFIKGVQQSQEQLQESLSTTLASQTSPLAFPLRTEETENSWLIPKEFLTKVAEIVGALRYMERILIDIKKFQ